MKNKQTINCDVANCKFNNTDKQLCNLNSISVSDDCGCNDCKNKKETICDSFEAKEK